MGEEWPDRKTTEGDFDFSSKRRPRVSDIAVRRATRPKLPPLLFLLAIALLFGGSTYRQSWPDAVVQLVSLPILLLSLSRISEWASDWRVRSAMLIIGMVLVLPLIQLLPLPPALWTRFPGRDAITAGFQAAGVPSPWLPISLSPSQTWRSTLSLIPPVATFFAALQLDVYGRRTTTLLLLCAGFISVLVGLAQVAAGPEGPFRFYGSAPGAQGFFLNRNHYAALLYSMLPFAAAWVVGLAADRRPHLLAGAVLSIIVFASLLLGLGVSASRAGVTLAIVAALASTALARTGVAVDAFYRARRLVIAAVIIGGVLVFQFALVGILQRIDVEDPLQDGRWEIASVTIRVIKDFFPIGSGFGTFDAAYDMYEGVELVVPTYVNNAHNDYLEILLEGGAPAALILGFFLFWFTRISVELWQKTPRGVSILDHSISKAGSICVVLLLLHSLVDYPLRSAALSCLLAFSCALMLPPAPFETARPRRSMAGRRYDP